MLTMGITGVELPMHRIQGSHASTRNITIFCEWSKTWLLNFNISKCYLLHLGPMIPIHFCGKYHINKSEITSTEPEFVKGLRIIVDSSLKFHLLTSTVASC